MTEPLSSSSSEQSPGSRRHAVGTWTFVKILCAIPLALVLLSWFARWLLLADLLCNFSVQLTAGLAVSAAVFMAGRRWFWTAAMLVVAIPGIVEIATVYIPVKQPAAGPKTIRILSLNLLYRNDQYQRVFELIDRVQPDVINLVEYDFHWRDGLQSLGDSYPYQMTDPRYAGLGNIILSKYPLRDLSDEPRLSRSALAVAGLQMDDRELCLISVHTISPTTLRRLNVRNRQLVQIADEVREHGLPTVVMGDFNATTWSPYMKDFITHSQLRDSRRGFGLQPTWPSWRWAWPVRIAIDHFFVSQEIHVSDRWVEANSGSDHLPIVIELSISQTSPSGGE